MTGNVVKLSPWLYGLDRTRPLVKLTGDAKADIAIVGAGIAGVSTAYFILTRTSHTVTLIDQSRVAEGASGNNAGTATPIFEKSLSDFITSFGPERVREGLDAIDDAWELLEEMYGYAEGMEMPQHLNGFFGYRTSDEVAPILSENAIRVSLGVSPREVFFAEEKKDSLVGPLQTMPGLRFIPAQDIARHLRTPDTRFAAAVAEHEALVNSASLCEKTVEQLLQQYPDRFTVFEESEVVSVSMESDFGLIETAAGTLHATKIVMATNGFEQFSLRGASGRDIDVRFHKNVTSRIGYMMGVFFPGRTPSPSSLAYVHPERATNVEQQTEFGISFVYVTERSYVKDGISGTLVTIGDPDSQFNHELVDYTKQIPFNRGVQKELERFLELHYGIRAVDEERFLWHGLMGYTEKYARLVGADPTIPNLMYNLGCNGVGILLSMWGGCRLAELLLGESFPPSMFDPVAHFSKK